MRKERGSALRKSSVVCGNRFIQWVLVVSSADLSSGGEGWVSNGEPQDVHRGTHILVPARTAAETNEGIQPINGRVRLKKEDAIYPGGLLSPYRNLAQCFWASQSYFFFIFTDF